MLSYTFSIKIELKRFFYCYEKIIYFFAITSVLIFGIALINRKIFSIFPTFTNIIWNQWYNLGICYIPINTTLRNYSIFREPGIYQFFLIISLLYCLKYNFKIKRIFVYILATISTYSTTGILALGLVLIFYIKTKSPNLREKKIKRLIIICLFLIILFLNKLSNFFSSDSIVFGKIFKFTESKSFIARFASISTNLDIFFNSNFIKYTL